VSLREAGAQRLSGRMPLPAFHHAKLASNRTEAAQTAPTTVDSGVGVRPTDGTRTSCDQRAAADRAASRRNSALRCPIVFVNKRTESRQRVSHAPPDRTRGNCKHAMTDSPLASPPSPKARARGMKRAAAGRGGRAPPRPPTGRDSSKKGLAAEGTRGRRR